MLKKRYVFTIIIVLLISCLIFVFSSYRERMRWYMTYYLTKLVIRYEHKLLNPDIFKRFYLNYLDENLDLLSEKVSTLLNQDQDVDKLSAVPPYFTYPVAVYDVSNNIKQKLYNLTMLINKLEKQQNIKQGIELKTFKFHKNITKNKTSFEVELPSHIEVINKKLIIRNTGDKQIINPKLIVNGKKRWFDLASIIHSIIKSNMTDEEKALSIWNFLNNNRYGFYPATEEPELHSVVKYLNAYGYGFCDDTARSFYLLANKAGLEARVWGLSGHVVSEAYFQNDWHLLDSDHKVFYLEKDNKTIASVEDLANNPELIYRVTKTRESFAAKPFIGNGKHEARLYTTKGNNFIGQYWMYSISEDYNLDFVLRPGESFIASWKGEGRYISYGQFYAHVPPKYGSGQFVYTPSLKQGIFLENVLKKNNVRVIKKDGHLVLAAVKPNQKAIFVVDFDLPYPITGANLGVDLSKKENGDSFSVSFSKDNEKWWEISRLDDKSFPSDSFIRVDFTNYFPNGYAQPLYSYFLKFEFLSAKPLSLTIKKIKIVTKTQLAPHSLPALEGGRNVITYFSDTPKEQFGEIEFQYSLGKKYHFLMNPPELILPKLDKDSILFSWNFPNNMDKSIAPVEYNFQLSARDDFLIPLSPNFDIITDNKQFRVENKWINPKQIYYCRVRSRYKGEPWGKFSKPLRLDFVSLSPTKAIRDS